MVPAYSAGYPVVPAFFFLLVLNIFLIDILFLIIFDFSELLSYFLLIIAHANPH